MGPVIPLLLVAQVVVAAPAPRNCEGQYLSTVGTNFGRCPASAPKTLTGSTPESPGDSAGDAASDSD